MLFGFHILLLLLQLLLILIKDDGVKHVMSLDVLDDLPEMTADEVPARVPGQLVSDLCSVAEYQDLGLDLNLLQEAMEEKPIIEVADDDRRDKVQLPAVLHHAGVAAKLYVVLGQFLLDLLEFSVAVVFVDDVYDLY